MIPFRLILLFLFIPIQPISAEYRTYELKIKDHSNQKERLIITTFDHIQYTDYYALNPNESIEYVDSWMCWGNTANFKSPCPKPKRTASSVSP